MFFASLKTFMLVTVALGIDSSTMPDHINQEANEVSFTVFGLNIRLPIPRHNVSLDNFLFYQILAIIYVDYLAGAGNTYYRYKYVRVSPMMLCLLPTLFKFNYG
jgi:hypothetical protein